MPVAEKQQLDRIEQKLDILLAGQAKDWYTTAEAALILHRSQFRVREWCRLGLCSAQKRIGIGGREWVISRDEVQRLKREGPRPARKVS
jgi:hypothetical protein